MGGCKLGSGRQLGLTGELEPEPCCPQEGMGGCGNNSSFCQVLFIFQEIKQSFFLPVNFLNKDILKPWKTFLSYFNCVKTVCAGRERGRRGEREKKRGGVVRREGEEGVQGAGSREERGRRGRGGGGGKQREDVFQKLQSSSSLTGTLSPSLLLSRLLLLPHPWLCLQPHDSALQDCHSAGGLFDNRASSTGASEVGEQGKDRHRWAQRLD